MYGRLTEAVHFSSYSADRALQQLEWLLEDDRWRLVDGGRFGNIDAFLESMKLDESYRLATEERKRIATRIKQLQPGASNRQIARTLRVNHKTVDRDLGANAPRHSEKTNEIKGPISEGGANAPPTSTSDVAVALDQSNVVAEIKKRRSDRAELAPTPRCEGARDAAERSPDQSNPSYLISQFAMHVREAGLEIARQIGTQHRPILVERLREIIDEIELETERWANQKQANEEGIPDFLRR
jgi:hypothetical protein